MACRHSRPRTTRPDHCPASLPGITSLPACRCLCARPHSRAGTSRWHSCILEPICGDRVERLAGIVESRSVGVRRVRVGSGQFGTPCERMHWANSACRSAPLPADSRRPGAHRAVVARRSGAGAAQACWAAWNWELLTPSCCAVALGEPLRCCRGRGSSAPRGSACRPSRRPLTGSSLTLPHSVSRRSRWMMGCRRMPPPAGPGRRWR